MYSDDGVQFPEAPIEPSQNIPAAGVRRALEDGKSKWVKRAGEWVLSFKFLGLRYIPSGFPDPLDGSVSSVARIRGDTRAGSVLEFGLEQQLSAFLSSRMKELLDLALRAGVGGPELLGSRLPSRPSLGQWVLSQVNDFISIPQVDRLRLLFSTEAGARMLSCIQGNSWQLGDSVVSRLEYVPGSWVYLRHGSWLWSLSPLRLRTLVAGRLELVDNELLVTDEGSRQ